MTTTTTTETAINVGTDTENKPVLVDPMLGSGLIAGTTRTGKTTFLRHLASGAVSAGAQVHVFDQTGLAYTGIDTTTTCVGDSPEALDTAADLLATVCDTMETRHETPNKTAGLKSEEQPILIVVDEYQMWSDSNLRQVFNHLVTRLLKVGRSAAITLWAATSQPDRRTIPRAMDHNFVYRVGFNQTGHIANDLVLGTGSYRNDINSVALPPHTAWIASPTAGPVLTSIDQ